MPNIPSLCPSVVSSQRNTTQLAFLERNDGLYPVEGSLFPSSPSSKSMLHMDKAIFLVIIQINYSYSICMHNGKLDNYNNKQHRFKNAVYSISNHCQLSVCIRGHH